MNIDKADAPIETMANGLAKYAVMAVIYKFEVSVGDAAITAYQEWKEKQA